MKTLFLHELFERQTQLNPDAVAIKCIGKSFTYRETNNLSQILAQHLLKLGITSNQLVAVIMDKGWEQVIAVLGILKAGGAYLPLDLADSEERIHNLLTISDVKIVLTLKKIESTLKWPKGTIVITVDSLENSSESNEVRTLSRDTSDLAYVIFTSGSTGQPKGVMISHRSVVNTVLDINERFAINEKDKILALSNLNFDLSVYDIFGVLAAGGTVVIPDSEQAKDPVQWYEIFIKEKVTIWNSVPALMDLFLEYIHHKGLKVSSHALRLILLSGDWIPLNLPPKIHSLLGQIKTVSLGGATEASIWSILYEIGEISPEWKSIPYGKAMKNQTFYVLNDKLDLLPNPEVGELYIGGQGVAEGYWKDKERTNKRFIFHSQFGKLYKTGDLGRYLPDGNIEFLGRVDFQVKIAGFRVEINAIEKYILDFPHTNQAVVLVNNNKEKKPRLVAYINFDYDSFLRKEHNSSLYIREQVNHWQQIYDALCINKFLPINEQTFNTVGWISSYDNQPIPKIQMQEWVASTVERISQLKPKSVLEIGCGTGLLLFPLAAITKQYDATDFSKTSLEHIQNQLNQLNIDNVTLKECDALKISELSKHYDTVILNSVAQYFPSLDYFIEVLDQSINSIERSGHVFIGDLRSLHLLNEFHASILLHRNISNYSYNEWKRAMLQSVEEDDELVIDYQFFEDYKYKNQRVSHIEILLKKGKYNNEMNNYRYDAILYIEQPITKIDKEIIEIQWDTNKSECINLEKIHSELSTYPSHLLSLSNVPNNRVKGLSYLINNSKEFQNDKWQEIFGKYTASNQFVDPEIFFEIAEEHGYYASITWSDEYPSERFNVVLEKYNPENFERKYLNYLNAPRRKSKEKTYYANSPIKPHINRALITELKAFLLKNLPKYMIPSYFVPVKELPMTVNGKVDRNILPIIDPPLIEKEYIKAHTDTQEKLVSIWKELLGIEHLGIRNDFHDIGGTSILLIQMIIKIHKIFDVELNLQEIRECISNIESLSDLIEERVGVLVSA
ncbi:Chondramide synthase cmdD [Legionella massiliensis]|uniref:Chondramide synthase cmdD n=1 Tax=Legionella massiliensis TaxID=1034943 RepID=A0A078L1W3_9GAMM|nr:amino acid adenylation domain-containing protein [Legionella massiliensis]CDZ78019.1 Chondramide synthase cmdD [Legionella massiliensis]CEE13757.1 Chondramide synthase cmdD [Legionella massiliensis]